MKKLLILLGAMALTFTLSFAGEGKCGEGKCGDAPKTTKCASDGKCATDKKDMKSKCGEGKCGDAKKDKKPATKGKCGQGKCG